MIPHGTKIKLFAGNSNPVLAKRIADALGLTLSDCVCKKFADGEISVCECLHIDQNLVIPCMVFHFIRLTAERVLIDADHFVIHENAAGLVAHLADIAADHQRGAKECP